LVLGGIESEVLNPKTASLSLPVAAATITIAP
jgi:hypothetical protein